MALKKWTKKRPTDYQRDCVGRVRPCPWFGCKWNLLIDINPETGSIIFNLPGRGRSKSTVPNKDNAKTRRAFDRFAERALEEMMRRKVEDIDTCVKDVLERECGEEVTLEEIGEMMSITRERVRQLEVIGEIKVNDSEQLKDWNVSDMPRKPGRNRHCRARRRRRKTKK